MAQSISLWSRLQALPPAPISWAQGTQHPVTQWKTDALSRWTHKGQQSHLSFTEEFGDPLKGSSISMENWPLQSYKDGEGPRRQDVRSAEAPGFAQARAKELRGGVMVAATPLRERMAALSSALCRQQQGLRGWHGAVSGEGRSVREWSQRAEGTVLTPELREHRDTTLRHQVRVVLCRIRGWTQWSLWVPSNSMVLI